MIREIVKDPLFLSRVSEKADKNDEAIGLDLLDTLLTNQERCVGMAANMIGFLKNIIAFHKPANISVTEDASSRYIFTSLVQEKYGNQVQPCHRLDRNTSGVLLYAKNEKALNIMLDKFKNKEVEKHYML